MTDCFRGRQWREAGALQAAGRREIRGKVGRRVTQRSGPGVRRTNRRVLRGVQQQLTVQLRIDRRRSVRAAAQAVCSVRSSKPADRSTTRVRIVRGARSIISSEHLVEQYTGVRPHSGGGLRWPQTGFGHWLRSVGRPLVTLLTTCELALDWLPF